jgi:hypothetical protein
MRTGDAGAFRDRLEPSGLFHHPPLARIVSLIRVWVGSAIGNA